MGERFWTVLAMAFGFTVGLACGTVGTLMIAIPHELTLTDMEQIKRGMNEEQVVQILGPPTTVTVQARGNAVIREWVGDNCAITVVFTDDGDVTTIGRSGGPPTKLFRRIQDLIHW